MKPAKVFVSGIGVVAPNGVGIQKYWSSCMEGISGIKRINLPDNGLTKTRIAGFVEGINDDTISHNLDITFYDRLSILVKHAADEALVNSGLKNDHASMHETGIVLGIATGGMSSLEKCYKDSFVEKNGYTFNEFLAAMPNTPANLLAMEYGARGINLTINTACSSSTTAIGIAYSLVKNGQIDRCITGGGEAPCTTTTFRNFEKLRILNKKSNDCPENGCRPFNRNRTGTVLSEGAAIAILESEKSILKRGCVPLCEIAGFGSNNDACHIVAPDVNGEEEVIRRALLDGSCKVSEIEYIQAHGTGTQLNDKIETEAIKRVYGKHAYGLAVSSVKSMIGHTLGASGSLSLAVTVLSMMNGFITPTINLDDPDPECDLDYTPNVGRNMKVTTSAVHSFGFGGNNSILLLRAL